MATVKSFTDLEQSRKLAEILPLESADMYYSHEFVNSAGDYYKLNIASEGYFDDEEILGSDIPCWSLAALLSVLPMITKGEDTANPFIAKTPDNEYYVVYATLTKEVDSSAIYDNPIDACVAMVEKLHKLNLL